MREICPKNNNFTCGWVSVGMNFFLWVARPRLSGDQARTLAGENLARAPREFSTIGADN
jgi:hypothetical protein